MKEDDWKKMLQKWMESKKYKKLKANLNLQKSYKMKDEELYSLYEATLEFNQLPLEEKQAFDLVDELMSPQDRIDYFIHFCMQMSFFEIRSVKAENYELAHKLKQMKLMEGQEVDRVIQTYHPNFLIEEGIIEDMIEYSFQEVKKHYDEWSESLNKTNESK
jgi:hypothetical protein